jgi:hypothetical protein
VLFCLLWPNVMKDMCTRMTHATRFEFNRSRRPLLSHASAPPSSPSLSPSFRLFFPFSILLLPAALRPVIITTVRLLEIAPSSFHNQHSLYAHPSALCSITTVLRHHDITPNRLVISDAGFKEKNGQNRRHDPETGGIETLLSIEPGLRDG